MDILNREELLIISLNLHISDVLKWSRVNKTINKKVCQSDDVWRRLVLRDYPNFTFENGQNGQNAKTSPRNIYTVKIWDFNGNINDLYSTKEITNNTTNVKIIPANLYLPNIEKLNLSNNSINYIPDIFNLPNLTELYLDYNDLKVIPTHILFPNLKILALAYNLISCVPRNLFSTFPKLEKFDLYGNQIEWVPEDLIMPNLTWIRFSTSNVKNLHLFIKRNPSAKII